MNGKSRRRRCKAALLLCLVLVLAGPVSPLTALADMDPDVISKAKEEAQAAADEMDSTPEPEEEEEQEEANEESTTAQSKYQDRIDEINREKAALAAEKDVIQKSINETKSAKDKELANKSYLDQQIGITRSEIALLEESIMLLEQDILEKENDITDKQADIDHSYDQFKKRLRALQLTDDATTLGLILGADSFADFLTRTETVSRIAEHDQALMESLTLQRIELEQAKEKLEDARVLVLAEKADEELKRQTLNVQLNAAQAAIQDLEQLEREYLADLEKNKAKADAMESELNEIYKQIEWDNNPYVGGEMAWPVPGYTNISSNYGPRFSGRDYHTGVDISGGSRGGIHGKPIVAANDGTVRFVNTKYTPGQGYGIYLIIDHGGNTSTLYAHCSSIVVNVGDKVKKGDTIAMVGSTGWSTGPHLHFEVRIDSKHVNPLPYITKS